MTTWMRGDVVTELTSNHLSSPATDKWVEAGGTIVNAVVGGVSLAISSRLGNRPNARYFLWLRRL